jgi:hypothetical protein
MLHKAITTIASTLSLLNIKRVFAALLVGFVVLNVAVDVGQADNTLGERMRDRIERTDRNSERPKTTGEFLNEADRDMPLGERLEVIGRDSAEALKQFGQEYSVGAQESARNIGEKAADAREDVANQVR